MIGFNCLKWRLSFDVADWHRVYRSHSIQVTAPIMSSRNLNKFLWNKFQIVTIWFCEYTFIQYSYEFWWTSW